MRATSFASLVSISLASLIASSGCGPRSPSGPGGPGSDSGTPTTTLCTDTCPFAFDGECDDGAAGSITSVCELGTDCGDCGPRVASCVPSCSGRECGPDGCGGSCGTCSGGGSCVDGVCATGPSEGCDPTQPPRCEGNVAVSCELVGGVGATIRETCAERCEGGECVSTARPTSVRITGSFGFVDPIFAGEPPDLSGLLSVTVSPPSYSPALPSRPRLFGAPSYTITSPSPGGCGVTAAFTLDATSLGVNMTGTGADCVVFLESAARDGFEIQLPGVPYEDGVGTVDVTIDVTP